MYAAESWFSMVKTLKSPESYRPKLHRLLPGPLLGTVRVDLVEPDDYLRECRPRHGLRGPNRRGRMVCLVHCTSVDFVKHYASTHATEVRTMAHRRGAMERALVL